MLHGSLFQTGEVDADLCSQQLERVHEILRRRYQALVNRNRVLLKQNNARPHNARTTVTKIHELEESNCLPHPANIHDLAPSDYFLFRSIAHFLRGRNLKNIEDAEPMQRTYLRRSFLKMCPTAGDETSRGRNPENGRRRDFGRRRRRQSGFQHTDRPRPSSPEFFNKDHRLIK